MKHNRKMLLNMMSLLLLAALCLSVSQKGAAAETLTCVVKNGQYVNVRNQASQTAATWGIAHGGHDRRQPQRNRQRLFQDDVQGPRRICVRQIL